MVVLRGPGLKPWPEARATSKYKGKSSSKNNGNSNSNNKSRSSNSRSLRDDKQKDRQTKGMTKKDWQLQKGKGLTLEKGLTVEKEGFDAVEVFFGVDAYGVEVGGFDVDGDVVFDEAELFEALGLFEDAGR